MSGSRLVRLDIQNVKRIKAVSIVPKGHVTVLAGRNKQGKTSTLDSVEMVLCGKDAIPSEPLRRGEEHGSVVMDLGQVLLTRTFTKTGGGSIKVEAKVDEKTKAIIKSPQSWLNEHVGSLVNPIEFMEKKGTEQAAMLRKMIGKDTTPLDEQRKKLYDLRTEANRVVATWRPQVELMTEYKDVPTEPVSTEELASEIDRFNAEKTALSRAETSRSAILSAIDVQEQAAKRQQKKVDDLVMELANARRDLQTIQAKINELSKEDVRLGEVITKTNANILALPTASVNERLAEIQSINTKVAANKARLEAREKLNRMVAESDALTAKIEDIDRQKREMLADAKFPIAGLGFGIDGLVTFNDLPFDQASGAEQIEVCFAISAALHPDIRIALIRDGSKLDDEAMATVADLAEKYDTDVLIERVGVGDAGAVIIEDGEIITLDEYKSLHPDHQEA